MIDVLKRILSDELGCDVDGDRYTFPSEMRLSVVLEHNGGVWTLPRVSSISFGAGYAGITTEEDCVYVYSERIIAFRQEEAVASSRPGFHG